MFLFLDAIFIQLRRGRPKEFFASWMLRFYGDRFIGRPKIEDLPVEAGAEVNQRIIDTWFNVQEDRLPPKRLKKWEVGQLKGAQIRDEEQHPISYAAVIVPTILCTLLFSMSDTRTYVEKRPELMKEWTAEIADYSAKKCMSEVEDLRVRKTDKDRDYYGALETGCASHRDEIVSIAKTWSIDDCADYLVDANKQITKDGGQMTWVDEVISQDVCFPKYGDALQARLK